MRWVTINTAVNLVLFSYRGGIDKKVVEIDKVFEQRRTVHFIVIKLWDGITQQIKCLQRLEPTQIRQLQTVQ